MRSKLAKFNFKNKMNFVGFLLCSFAFSAVFGGKILVLVPTPAISHAIIFNNLVSELAKKGHEVTIVTVYNQTATHKNLKQIIIPNNTNRVQGAIGVSLFDMKELNPMLLAFIMPKMGQVLVEDFLSLKEVQNILNSGEKYDVIIGEVFLNEAVLAGFSHKLKAPLIAFNSASLSHFTEYYVGNPSPAAYIPNMELGFPVKMNFWQRTKNALTSFYNEAMHTILHVKSQEELFKKYFGENTPPLKEIIFNTSLLFVNYHQALAFPRPYLPNVIELAGIHVKAPKPLPKDLQEYMDDSKDGVILFSMGSVLKGANMPKEKIGIFLNAFSKVKQNVLWKFEDDDLPGKPENVKISKWLPQSDILAHPNLKLFITHGGLLSTIEAVYRGVPIIGIPIFADQPSNMRLAENAGYGKSLDFHSLTSESLQRTIGEMISDPKYKENVQHRSKILKDTPKTALETAIFWVEYVIRHKGAMHLRSAAQDLSWYQIYLLDVIGFLILLTSAALLISYKITKFAFKKLFGCKLKNLKTSSQKKNS